MCEEGRARLTCTTSPLERQAEEVYRWRAEEKKEGSALRVRSTTTPRQAPRTSLHIGVSPVLDGVLLALVGNLLGEVIMRIVTLQPAREEGHDVKEVGVVDFDGDVVHPWNNPAGVPGQREEQRQLGATKEKA